jgi:hypothetical protein
MVITCSLFSDRPKERLDCTPVFKWMLICCTIPASLSYIAYRGLINFTNGMAIIISVLLTIFYWLFEHSSEPYGLFHLDMNKLPGAGGISIPQTEWLNMGYWKVLVKPFPCFGSRMRTLHRIQMCSLRHAKVSHRPYIYII